MPDEPSDSPRRKRFAASRARVESGIESGRTRVDKARSSSPTVAFAFDAFAHDGETGGVVLAAALGFRTFLFQIPYFCFLAILGGYIADLFDTTPKEIFHTRGIGTLTAQAMTNLGNLSGGARLTALVVAAYATFLGARSFVKVLYIVSTLVWRVPPKKPAKPTKATFGFLGIISASFALSLGIGALRHRVIIGAVLGLVLYTFVPFLVWLCVSWWLPRRECQAWALAPGAMLFAVGVQALHVFTVVWLPHQIQSKSEVYGALGIALVLLLWAYLLGRLMTLATVLNAVLWTHREEADPGASMRPLRLPFLNDSVGLVVERFFPPRRDL